MHESRLASVYRRLLSVSAPLLSSFQSNSPSGLKGVSFSFSSGQLPHSCIRLFSLSQDCSDPSDLGKWRQVHARTILFGDVGSLQNRILGMYVLCGRFTDAKNLFFRIERAVPLPWTWMIRAFTSMGRFELAVLMYFKMWSGGVVPDKYTFPLVIKACCGLAAVEMGRDIHETIRMLGLETDLFIGSSLIKMYVEVGLIFDAREVFDKMPLRDCILWNVMIDGYARNNYVKEAINLFRNMRYSTSKLNDVSFVSIFSICASQGMLKYGIQLHGLAIRCGVDNETPVANTLLSMYSKCQCWFDMHKLFDSMGEVDLVTWNGIISGYVQNGLIEEALDSFYEMQTFDVKPDSVTCTCILPAFTNFRGVMQGM